jgi:hypothetical protein
MIRHTPSISGELAMGKNSTLLLATDFLHSRQQYSVDYMCPILEKNNFRITVEKKGHS